MKRKLVKQGKGALTISVPAKWAQKYNLSAGSEVEIAEDNEVLILKTKNADAEKKTKLNLHDDTIESYRSVIGGLYRAGFDEIEVLYDNSKIVPKLQEAINYMHGFEILEVGTKRCIIKSISKEVVDDVSPYIRRIIHTISTMQDIIRESIDEIDKHSKEEIMHLSKSLHRQRDFIQRMIKKHKLFHDHNFPHYTIALSLWGVARNYRLLFSHHNAKEEKHKREVIKKTFNHFSKSFKKIKNLETKEFLARNKEYQELRNILIHSKPTKTNMFCLNALMSMQLADSAIYQLNHDDDF